MGRNETAAHLCILLAELREAAAEHEACTQGEMEERRRGEAEARERHIRETTERAREEWRVYLERALVGAQVDKWAQVASELGAEGW